jgi:hypothetical protein
MIKMPIYMGDIKGATILEYIHGEPDKLKVILIDGRVAEIYPNNGDELEAVVMGDHQ